MPFITSINLCSRLISVGSKYDRSRHTTSQENLTGLSLVSPRFQCIYIIPAGIFKLQDNPCNDGSLFAVPDGPAKEEKLIHSKGDSLWGSRLFWKIPCEEAYNRSRSFSLRTKIVVKSATRNYVVKKLLRRLGWRDRNGLLSKACSNVENKPRCFGLRSGMDFSLFADTLKSGPFKYGCDDDY